MATIMMTRKEAEQRLKDAMIPADLYGGGHTLIDALEALGLIKIDEEMLVVDVVDKKPVIIKRNGKIIYQE